MRDPFLDPYQVLVPLVPVAGENQVERLVLQPTAPSACCFLVPSARPSVATERASLVVAGPVGAAETVLEKVPTVEGTDRTRIGMDRAGPGNRLGAVGMD